MEADLQAHVAFFLSGKANTPNLEVLDRLELRPAQFAAYGDLTRLRYDFPLILTADGVGVESLSGLIDGILARIAHGNNAERIRKHVLALERLIRAQTAVGKKGKFSALWDEAAKELGGKDKALAESLSLARANLKTDGEVIDCNGATPKQLIRHVWALTQARRARRFGEIARRLVIKLSEILQADFANSSAGRSAANLERTFGSGPLDKFDFEAMSRLLTRSAPKENLCGRRKQRIERLLEILKTQQFFATPYSTGKPYDFAFESCNEAIEAYRERLPKAIELSKAVAIGELEVKGEYNEAKHDRLFESFGENGLDPHETDFFPDYLACVQADRLPGGELAALTEIMSLDLPIKVLVQTDDVIEESPIGNSHLAFSLRSRQLARMALGMVGVFVVQAPSSALYPLREKIARGLDYPGPALFSIFSGAVKESRLPPYLVGAAALESRVFPAFTMDPTAGEDWASRFSLDANPQVELDWPIHRVVYEDGNCQSVAEEHPFTLIDFVASDARYGKFFAAVAKANWEEGLAEAGKIIGKGPRGNIDRIDSVPSLLLVDAENRLQKVIATEKIVREARRCLSVWNSLQELGGIHNSHTEKRLAQEKAAWEESRQAILSAAAQAPAAESAAPAASADAGAAPAPAESEAEKSDEAYIETPRCASCNECIQVNGKMFAYDGNKQAFIKDLAAGTYAQLVEAAENCQVAIIHPGKPRNVSEPGLDELIKRA
ncbi:MAG: hypothetical protein LBC91_02100, partial [Candidatus Accumulibacter sp.]|nr:hypothetical protein [Accumulibacter sp.]